MKKGLIAISADSGDNYYQELPATIVFENTWMISLDCCSCKRTINIKDAFKINSFSVGVRSFTDYGSLTSRKISNLDTVYVQFNTVIKDTVNNIECIYQKDETNNSAGPLTNCASFVCPHCNRKYLMLYYLRLREEYRSPESQTRSSITILEIISGDNIEFPIFK